MLSKREGTQGDSIILRRTSQEAYEVEEGCVLVRQVLDFCCGVAEGCKREVKIRILKCAIMKLVSFEIQNVIQLSLL